MRCHDIFLFLALILVISQSVKGVSEAFEKAEGIIREENSLFRERHNSEIDLRNEQFTTVEPGLFDVTTELGNLIEERSRLINWISFLLRKEGSFEEFSEVLEEEKNLVCPFEKPKKCPDESKYRSYDGVCNNKKHPLLGAAFTPFPRDLPPAYEEANDPDFDIDDQPRETGKNGEALPNARVISRAIHQMEPSLSKFITSFLFTGWAQFLAHEITERAVSEGYNSAIIACCDQTIKTPQSECFNIDVPPGDPLNTSCLAFARSLEATDLHCEMGRREQLNTATSFIDASAVYSVSEERANFLRTFSGGKLITSDPKQLPHGCPRNEIATKRGFNFVQAGDSRAAEVAFLTGVHTMWVRQHNKIAEGLGSLDDETLFQKSRRIISAMIQHITYNEWLPLLVGPDMISEYNLTLLSSGYYEDYNPHVIPGTSNVVATAAMRFGHSLVSGTFDLYDKEYSRDTSKFLTLRNLFFRPNFYLMHEQGLMRGLLVDPSESMDPFLTNDLTNHLFELTPDHGAGDLAAFNIQRGRDHGLPPYNEWRESFNLPIASLPDIPLSIAEKLDELYDHPDDIDVFVGGVSEVPVEGGTVGPLFANLLARQFSRYRQGDRFWYETSEKPQRFSEEELKQIRGVTMAEIMCNTFHLATIQPRAFELPSKSNKMVPCSSIQKFDISPFKHH